MSRYRTPLPWHWFTRKRGYRMFMIREATSVVIAGYLVWLLFWLGRLGEGPDAFATMLDAASTPTSILLHVLALAAALFHSITWFNLTPKIMPMYIGEDRVPDLLAAIAMGYLPWVVVSVAVLWGLVR